MDTKFRHHVAFLVIRLKEYNKAETAAMTTVGKTGKARRAILRSLNLCEKHKMETITVLETAMNQMTGEHGKYSPAYKLAEAFLKHALTGFTDWENEITNRKDN